MAYARHLSPTLSLVALWVLLTAACGHGQKAGVAVEVGVQRDEHVPGVALQPSAPPPVTPAAPMASGPATSPEPTAAQAAPPPALPQPGERIYSKARFAWIQPAPRMSNGWLGYLGLGGSVKIRGTASAARLAGSGGCKAWVPVEPVGYVCEGDTATTDPHDPIVAQLAVDAPKIDSPWPYNYGESAGAPRYPTLPSHEEQRRNEWDLEPHLARLAAARAGEPRDPLLVGIDIERSHLDPAPWTILSPYVREERKFVATGSTVAYTRTFDFEGRGFLVTHDHAVVPRDRVKPYPRSEFHGVAIGSDLTLPLAFFRGHARPKYRRDPSGAFVKTGDTWARLSHVGLTGSSEKAGSETYLATTEPGTYVLETDACVARMKPMPAILGNAPPTARRTWVDISVLGGTLVAFEGEKPIYATLISPGRGGVPMKGVDPLKTASTPTGTYRVDGKLVTATMVSSTNDLLVHTEVQYVQNFHGPHSLHGAYWHDAWGEKKSGGCVNIAPIDAQFLFHWSEPTLPEGWYAMRSVSEFGPATIVVVHE